MIDSALAVSERWRVGLIAFSFLAVFFVSFFGESARLCALRKSPCRFLAGRIEGCVTIICFVYLLCLLFPLALIAQRGHPSQYDVEAVYLYQFGRFVQWPSQNAAPTDSFPICVLGRDPFGKTLDTTIAGESIGLLPLRADRLVDANDAKHCRILFISDSENEHLAEILDSLQKSPVLTVSESQDFITRGGMIQFAVVDNRVRFEINLATAEKAGLAVSSQLLKVASTVHGARSAGANQ